MSEERSTAVPEHFRRRVRDMRDPEAPASLRAESVGMEFSTRGGLFRRRGTPNRVLTAVKLVLPVGKILGVVGESGSGKTTLARILAGLLRPTSGQVYLNDNLLYLRNGSRDADARKAIRFIFQNVDAPLNPRIRIYKILEEPLKVHTRLGKGGRQRRIEDAAAEVELPSTLFDKYPWQLSGGEKRRVSIARALMYRPSFIIADEPSAGLDADLCEGFIALFRKLAEVERIGVLVVSHEIPMLKVLCDEVVELRDGNVRPFVFG